tara:strand:+ start:2275 stop:3933 length:1659 start_codon:yes stop_codon:yes gene_type:complete
MAGQDTRTPGNNKFEGPGPFVAIVRGHLDAEYMGTLQVELLKTSQAGNLTNEPGQMATVSYLSPFYGVTPYSGTSDNDGFDHSQKSYGMWMVPPDIGSQVLVIFAEGNKSRGYWIGCIQESFMNFMVPGNASTKYNKDDQTKILPVAEYNKRNEKGTGNDPTQFLKPVNTDAVAQLTKAGLLTDQIRGTTTSSARREVPSMVFGLSTPGPLDRRPGKPKVKIGADNAQTEIPASRLTGSSFVMDDGDPSMFRKGPAATTPSEYASIADGGDPTLPMNELVRLKTRTGHQILLHNTEDLIYISHGSGGSYIEMTASGKIDIYAADSISIHSEQDLNFKADRHINLEAGENVNIKSGNRISVESTTNFQLKAGADGLITCVGSMNIASAEHRETAAAIHMNSGGAVAATAGSTPSITRVPGPGSGPEKENKNPAEHTAIKQNNSLAANSPATETEDKTVAQEDTFAKCPPMEMETTVAAGTGADGPAAQHKVTDTPSRTAALDGGIPVGTTEPGGKSLLRQRQEAKALDAFGGSGAKVTDTASRTSGPDDGLRG